jgi:DNA-binding transcriptional MerR regulator
VSLRTLRYYDRVGLLSPAQHTEAGYRLYTEADLFRLQQILALKFLGFSLAEIKACLQAGPQRLPEALAQQKAMLREKRSHLEAILRAIEETEALLQAGQCSWEAIGRVIQVIQMDQKKEWVKKHFTDEQQQKMEELSKSAYTEEARQKLEQRGEWTEADQQRASEQWTYLATEARRLAAAGADPAGPEAQALAKLKCELLSAFTQGDAEIEGGLKRFWEQFNALPQEEKPFDRAPYDPGPEGGALLDQAMAIYQRGT